MEELECLHEEEIEEENEEIEEIEEVEKDDLDNAFAAKKRKLINAKEHIMSMPNTREKLEHIYGYFELFQFYREILQESDEEELTDEEFEEKFGDIYLDGEFTDRYDRVTIRDTQKDFTNLSLSTLSLYRQYSKIIDTFKENNFYSYRSSHSAKVNHKKMMMLIYNFFKMLGDDVLNLYLRMCDKGNIFAGFTEDYYLGFAHDSQPIDDPNVIVRNIVYNFDFYLTIVHEVGHAYQYYLLRNQRNFSTLSPYAEVTSHVLEKLFIVYLESVNEYENCFEYERYDLNMYLNEISSSKILCRLLINNNIKMINPFNLDFDCYIPPEKLNEDMLKDCGFIIRRKDIIKKDKIPERECKNKKEYLAYLKEVEERKEQLAHAKMNQSSVNIEDIKYAIGKSLAMTFCEKIKNNFDEEWKNYKNFVCTMNYLPLKEVVEKYVDTDIISEKIKKYSKSYR